MKYFLCIILLLFAHSLLGASMVIPSDTLSLTLAEAEQRFLNHNAQLLASKFTIDAASGVIHQAGIWSNPNLTIGQNAYNSETNRYFDVTSSGNTDVQLQQLILLAGKRDKQIRLAEANKDIASLAFDDLVRALRFELRSSFFRLYFLQKTLSFYDESIATVQKTVSISEAVFQRRSMLLSEMLRLKALLFTLENERLDIHKQITESMADLSVVIGDGEAAKVIVPSPTQQELERVSLDTTTIGQLIDLALQHRADMKSAEATVRAQQANLDLQQALSVPDLTIGGLWSRAGGYVPNYFAMTFSIDLPMFNRNQGNIETAEASLNANKHQLDAARRQVVKDVITAFQKAVETNKLYDGFDTKFPEEQRQLMEGMARNYQNRNISIIEFTDFFESYRSSMVQVNQLHSACLQAIEELKFAVGIDLFNHYQQ